MALQAKLSGARLVNHPPNVAFGTTPTPQPEWTTVCPIAAISDGDGDTVSQAISWTKNGSNYTGSTSTTTYRDDTIPGSATVDGDVFECSVTANDGYQIKTYRSGGILVEGCNVTVKVELYDHSARTPSWLTLVNAHKEPIDSATTRLDNYMQPGVGLYDSVRYKPSSYVGCGMGLIAGMEVTGFQHPQHRCGVLVV